MADEAAARDRVDVVRQAFEAANRGDIEPLVGIIAPGGILETEGVGRFEGADSVRSYLEGWFGTFDELAFELEESADLGGDVTFAVTVLTGRPSGTTARVTLRVANVLVWIGSKVAQNTQSTDIDEARAAAERLAEERG